MSVNKSDVMAVLTRIALPSGGDLASSDMIRALSVEGDVVRFIIDRSICFCGSMDVVGEILFELVHRYLKGR